jgi:hypothetical protein
MSLHNTKVTHAISWDNIIKKKLGINEMYNINACKSKY